MKIIDVSYGAAEFWQGGTGIQRVRLDLAPDGHEGSSGGHPACDISPALQRRSWRAAWDGAEADSTD